MFTGLIDHLGTLHARTLTGTGQRLLVRCETLAAKEVRIGDSIAVDGCCLTAAQHPSAMDGGQGCELAFDVIPQTLSLTTLGILEVGSSVHLEPALTLASRLGGHMVQGHVDCVGKVLAITQQPAWRVRVGLPQELFAAIVPQGSVTLAGVSLTIAACGDGSSENASWLEVALIPTTLAKTKLAALNLGDGINVECDMIAKQVAMVVKRMLSVAQPAHAPRL